MILYEISDIKILFCNKYNIENNEESIKNKF